MEKVMETQPLTEAIPQPNEFPKNSEEADIFLKIIHLCFDIDRISL